MLGCFTGLFQLSPPVSAEGVQGASQMLSVQRIVQALEETHATVASVGTVIGTLGNRLGGEYMTVPRDTRLGDVRIAVRQNRSVDVSPLGVTIYPLKSPENKLSELVPFCGKWRLVPNNPGASPFFYACDSYHSSGVPVDITAVLDADFGEARAQVTALYLQRQSLE